MATIKVDGMDELVTKLEKLTSLSDSREFVGRAIYEGAKVVKGAFVAGIGSIPVGNKYAKPGEKINTITSVQKAGLMSGFGIARMRDNGGTYDVKLGFNGYNGQKTKKWPGGQPNAMIARSVVSGTSFRAKNDFIGRAARSSRAGAVKAMESKIREQIEQIM